METVLWKKINTPNSASENKISSELGGSRELPAGRESVLEKQSVIKTWKTSWSRSAYIFFLSVLWKLFSFEHCLEGFLFCFVLFLICSLCRVVLSAYSTGSVKQLKVIFRLNWEKKIQQNKLQRKQIPKCVYIKEFWNIFVKVRLFQPQEMSSFEVGSNAWDMVMGQPTR